jgi:hypothetical protein
MNPPVNNAKGPGEVVKVEKKGGRKGWATDEQDKWLRERIPAYHAAQASGARGLSEYWPLLWEGWFSLWPESAGASSSEPAALLSVTTDQQCEAVQARKLVSFTTHIFDSMLTWLYSESNSGLTIIHVPAILQSRVSRSSISQKRNPRSFSQPKPTLDSTTTRK